MSKLRFVMAGPGPSLGLGLGLGATKCSYLANRQNPRKCHTHPPAAARLRAAFRRPAVSSGASVTNEAQAARSAEDNVRTYRFVKEYPAKTGVKSSQSGNPSHCFGAGASLRGPTGEGAAYSPTLVASARMATIAVTASRASGPEARTVTCCPLLAPSCMTASTLFRSACFAPALSWIVQSNFAAATDSAPAGRACRSPASVIVSSQLSGMACLLCRFEHGLDVAAARGGDGGRHRTLHERRVGHHHRGRQVLGIGEQRSDGEHRAAQVWQDDDAGPAVGQPDCALDLVDAGADAPVIGAAGGADDDAGSADLSREFRRTFG